MVVSLSMCCFTARSLSKDGSGQWMQRWFSAAKMIILVSLLDFSLSDEYLTCIGSLLLEPGVSLQFPRESRRSGLNMRASAAVAMNALMLLPDTSSAALSLRLSGCSWRVARRKVCNWV